MDFVYGMDVSKYQGLMNWDIAMKKVQFAYIRSSADVGYLDPQFANNWAGSKGKVVRGMYHYVKPGKLTWDKQAEFFASLQKPDAELPPVIDVEDNGGMSKGDLESFLVKFLGRFEYLTKLQPMIYTSFGFWNSKLPLTNWAKHYKLMIASWGGSKPSIPNDWMCNNCPLPYFTIWQYSANGNGKGKEYGAINTTEKDIDLDIYKGSVDMFNEEFNTSIGPLKITIPTITFPTSAVVITANLNLRATPTLAGLKLGYLLKGAEVIVQEQKIVSSSEVWVRVGQNLWAAKKYANQEYISYI